MDERQPDSTGEFRDLFHRSRRMSDYIFKWLLSGLSALLLALTGFAWTSIAGRLDRMDERTDRIDQTQGQHGTRLGKLEAHTEHNGATLTRMEGKVDAQRESMIELKVLSLAAQTAQVTTAQAAATQASAAAQRATRGPPYDPRVAK